MKRRFERIGVVSKRRLGEKYPELRIDDHDLGGIHAESIQTLADPKRVILHAHGGGYHMGSSASFRVRMKNLAHRCKAKVYTPDYRRSPDHPFPAAFDDILAAWKQLTVLHADVPLYLTGDSCGGGLALAVAMALRDAGERLPNAILCISPWTDMTGSGESMTTNAKRDGWLTRAHIDAWARMYLAGADARDPRASPLYGRFSQLPPLLLVVGDREVLLDDALRCAAKAREAGGSCEVIVGRDMGHDYPLSLPWLAESKLGWKRIAAFVEAHDLAQSAPS